MRYIPLKDHLYNESYVLCQNKDFMHLYVNKMSYISLASHYIRENAAMAGCYKNFLINNFLISQTNLIKFALKLFARICLFFQTYLLVNMHFSLKVLKSNLRQFFTF